MNKRNLAVLTLGVSALGAGLFWQAQRSKRAPVNEAPPAPPPVAQAAPAEITKNNSLVITKIDDPRRVRDFAFQKAKASFEADGVNITNAGELTMKSQVTDGVLKQQLVSAVVSKPGDKPKRLARNAAPQATVEAADKFGSLRYDSFFEGLDLEYKYDGKDVEELFHLGGELKKQLVESKSDLEITSLFPGLSQKNGAMIESADGLSSLPRTLPLPEGKVPPPMHTETTIASVGTVVINNPPHRFMLPDAVAIDARGKRTQLVRTFNWTKNGLEVALRMPASVLSEMEGAVVIDPSIIDRGREIQIRTWNENNIVVDATGRFHIAYMGVSAGRWRAMYTQGDGLNWETPTVIDPRNSPGEGTHYTPNLVIDANGTLHALWADYGNNAEAPVERGRETDYGHRLHYAQCPNRCVTRNWGWNGPNGFTQYGRLLAPTPAYHQPYHHMAVDRDNIVHIVFEEQAPYRQRYFQISGNGGATLEERAGPGQNYHSSYVVVDNNNTIHYLGADYWNNYEVKHYVYNGPQDRWEPRANMVPRAGMPGAIQGDNGGRQSLHSLTAVVDANNNIHAAMQAYDHWWQAKWHMVYGRFEQSGANNGTWQDVGDVNKPAATAPNEQYAMITVDNAFTAHLLWWRESDPQRLILYASKQAGQNWTPTQQLFYTNSSQSPPQVRRRLSWPQGPNNNVTAGILDVVYVLFGAELRYASTGGPVDGPVLFSPRDHAFISNTRPTFEWRRIGSDNGTNTSYTLELDSSPLFPNATVINVANNAVTHTLNGTAGTNGQVGQLLVNGNYYYWRVAARNAYGVGPYSAIFELGADLTPPAAFNLLTPADNSDPGTKTPRFTWGAAAD